MNHLTPDALEHAADLISQADGLVIAAGAGMGVDSGLPDFRGQEGFWKAYPALAAVQMDFTSIANPQGFSDDPVLSWGFYGHRLDLYRKTVPHDGFTLLKKWAGMMPLGATIFTSNVDGQFQKAGFDPLQIHECHGSLHHLQCLTSCAESIWPADDFMPEVDEAQCRMTSPLPLCARCGGLARPNILMFGDWEWQARRTEQQAKQQEAWLNKVSRPVVVELGAGKAIPTVRHFCERVITKYSGRLIRINPREWQVPTPRDIGLQAGALAGLQAIGETLGGEWKI